MIAYCLVYRANSTVHQLTQILQVPARIGHDIARWRSRLQIRVTFELDVVDGAQDLRHIYLTLAEISLVLDVEHADAVAAERANLGGHVVPVIGRVADVVPD